MDRPPTLRELDLTPDLLAMALRYNQLHQELCPRGIYCSQHPPAATIIEAVRREHRD